MSTLFRVINILLLAVLAVVFIGCEKFTGEDRMFVELDSSYTNINFSNNLSYTQSFNQYTYRNFYAGGGVGLGDFNGDGRTDIYLTSNQGRNKLYINKGDFEFEDVTAEAGVGGEKPWTTGVSIADVNGDGYLDIYVLNSGQHGEEDRKNELFINNGDLSFTERAEEFGIADVGNSIHAAFFDYNKDGRLDLFILNNYASKSIEDYDQSKDLRSGTHLRGGDRLYKNEGDSFTDVTEKSGIHSSEIGFGLGVSVGDVNRNGWPDIYVYNDFFEKDYLYINNKDGTFSEVIDSTLGSISTTSMGGDIADLNSDGYPELFATDMLPNNEDRLKTVTDFISWKEYQQEVELGYHQKFTRNTLQYNNKDGTFSEIGRYAGVEATAWSWGALMADFNLDGRRDIFVSNGFYKDVTDNDLALRLQDREVRKSLFNGRQIDYVKLLEMTPSVPLSNYLFENEGGMRFTNRAQDWGVGTPNFSSGAAYGDLDNDGDLDLVVNNVNDQPFVYRNRITEEHPDLSWLKIDLVGESPNTEAVGAQVEVIADARLHYAEQMPQRGFQSSVDPTLHFGLGSEVETIDTLRVQWPDGRSTLRTDVEPNRTIELQQAKATEREQTDSVKPASREDKDPMLVDVTEEVGIDWAHQESPHNDFERSPLLMQMRSTEGPPLCSGDVNNDGREDIYVGGARDQSGTLFLQRADGGFQNVPQSSLEADREAEDTDCEFFDADGDGVPELYVASGSSEFESGSPHLTDRLYRFDSQSGLVRNEEALPEPETEATPTGAVDVADVDGDGDLDLFVGSRMVPPSEASARGYGSPVGGRLLVNDGRGHFRHATDQLAPGLRAEELKTPGITDAEWGDLNADGSPDLVVVGEWMPITVFFNRGGRLKRADPKSIGLGNTQGWWQSVTVADLDDNGALDLVAGNHGLNSRFRAEPEEPVHMWSGDLNRDETLDHVIATYNDGEGPYPVALYQNIVQQLPYLKSEYPTFSDYAETPVSEMFGREQLEEADHYRADQLASVVAWNMGEDDFQVDSLPFRAQLAPMYGGLAEDLDEDGGSELLLGGNLDAVQPQIGAFDASYGVYLEQDSLRGYAGKSSAESGFFSPGEIRSIQSLQVGGDLHVFVARNDAPIQVLRATE